MCPKNNPVNITADTPKVILPTFTLPKNTPKPMASIMVMSDCAMLGVSVGNIRFPSHSNIVLVLILLNKFRNNINLI